MRLTRSKRLTPLIQDSGSIPGRVKPKTIKIGFTTSLLDVQQLKGQCEASIVCGRQVGRW